VSGFILFAVVMLVAAALMPGWNDHEDTAFGVVAMCVFVLVVGIAVLVD